MRLFLRVVAHRLDRETMLRVYGWYPERPECSNGNSRFNRCLRRSRNRGFAHMVGGSLASSVHGIYRSTNDIDLIADIKEPHHRQCSSSIREEPSMLIRKRCARHFCAGGPST